jgi:hypothetical protein
MVRRRDQRLLEIAARENGDAFIKHVPQIIEATFADLRQDGSPLGVVDQGQHAVLVRGRGSRVLLMRGVSAHSDDHGSRKLGNSVRPPSTKIVWPVM